MDKFIVLMQKKGIRYLMLILPIIVFHVLLFVVLFIDKNYLFFVIGLILAVIILINTAIIMYCDNKYREKEIDKFLK
jgi:hypothetical protein